jgi:ABC-type glycerol-3-phosphate transport system substrate-binding protein
LAVSAGKLAMLLDGSWSLAAWAKGEPQGAPQWDVAVLPKGPVGRSTCQSSDGWATWTAALTAAFVKNGQAVAEAFRSAAQKATAIVTAG